jgi:hypothetical protein
VLPTLTFAGMEAIEKCACWLAEYFVALAAAAVFAPRFTETFSEISRADAFATKV